MARNLNYNASGSKCGNGSSLSDENTSTCDTYGRLYDWATAMALPSNCNYESCSSQINAKHKGVCPSGWHIPSDAEWTTLTDYVGGSTTGTKLKAKSGWNDGGNGTDEFGFAALPGGYGSSNGSFYGVGKDGYWWSATEHSTSIAWYRYIYYNYADVGRDIRGKTLSISVRCVKD
jgi:uncharacterized protein (TIGR02145 family)